MRLIRKFGTLFTLLAALSVATWSIGCSQNTDAKTKGKTPAVKKTPPAQDGSGTNGGETGSTDVKSNHDPVIPGTVDDNPDGVGSGTGAGIKLDDLDNNK